MLSHTLLEQRGPLSTQTITVSAGVASRSDPEPWGCHLTFTLDGCASTHTTTSGYLWVVGCVLIVEIDLSDVDDDSDPDVEVENLMTYLGRFEMLSAIVIVFQYMQYSNLCLVMERHRPVQFDADHTGYTYLFVCQIDPYSSNDPFISWEVPKPDWDWKWAGINPITLAPTGTSSYGTLFTLTLTV